MQLLDGSPGPTSGNLLLVEDDADDRLLFCYAIDKAGLKVHVAQVAHGQEAVDYLEGAGVFADRERFPLPDVIVLDLAMPVMNGLELLHWLRNSPRWRDLPVLVVTGGSDPSWETAARALGVAKVLEKSVRIEDLTLLLQEIAAFLPGQGAHTTFRLVRDKAA